MIRPAIAGRRPIPSWRPEYRGQDCGPFGILPSPQLALPRQRHLPTRIRACGRECIAAGLVGGEGFAVDASLIVACANKQRSIPGKDCDKRRDPATASQAVKEYVATLDDAAFGAASDVTPKFVSPFVPGGVWTGAMRGPAFFAYADNYLIDVKLGIIMDVKASRAIRQAEVGAAKTMIKRTEERFGLKPERLAAGHDRLTRRWPLDTERLPAIGLRLEHLVPEGRVRIARVRGESRYDRGVLRRRGVRTGLRSPK